MLLPPTFTSKGMEKRSFWGTGLMYQRVGTGGDSGQIFNGEEPQRPIYPAKESKQGILRVGHRHHPPFLSTAALS